jgi:monoamine oxidase|tara:strand:- start:385 stop:1629 length:1245 start_codon:yes stop_codon:yes gene_type:complete
MTEKIIIIGAGAAGIGAGLRLKALGVPFIILEANDRIGGRAYTDNTSLSSKWDKGCSWFHCADINPLVDWADKLGTLYDKQDRSENALYWSESHWLDPTESTSVNLNISKRFQEIYVAAELGHDVSISDIPINNSFEAAVSEELVKLMCSEETHFTSAVGYGDYNDTGVNWMVTSGYGDLISRMAADAPIRINTKVSEISYQKGGVRVETSSGQLDARAVIVTTSTNVLRSGQISLPAGPAQEILELVEDVPCGTYEKIAIEFEQYPFNPANNEAVWIQSYSDSNPIYFQISPQKKPMLIAHVAGEQARELVQTGSQGMADFAIQKLTSVFGSKINKTICGTATTSWQADPLIQGGYSYARIGAGHNRQKMIELDTGEIVFAGEAFSLPWYGTAHGAYQSGKDVASQLVRSFNL